MTTVGIEALNIFAGTCYLDVEKLANHRGSTPRGSPTSS